MLTRTRRQTLLPFSNSTATAGDSRPSTQPEIWARCPAVLVPGTVSIYRPRSRAETVSVKETSTISITDIDLRVLRGNLPVCMHKDHGERDCDWRRSTEQ